MNIKNIPVLGAFVKLKTAGKLYALFGSISLVITITGILSVIQIDKLKNASITLGEKSAPLIDACMELKLTAVEAHLLFEEVMAGDKSENIAEVWTLLESSIWYADAILNGASNDEGTFLKVLIQL